MSSGEVSVDGDGRNDRLAASIVKLVREAGFPADESPTISAALDAIASRNGDGDVTQAVLTEVCPHLGVGGAVLKRLDSPTATLVPTAFFGRQASLLRAMPAISLDSELEAARVVADGRPVYVEDEHGAARTDFGSAVGRWRDDIETGSHSRLPLISPSGVVGTLALHWPQPRQFPPEERRLLELLARVLALTLESDQEFAARGPEMRRHTVEVTHDGVVLPAADTASVENSVVRVCFATSAGEHSGASGTAFHEVLALPDGRVGILLGQLTGDASDVDRVRSLVRSAVRARCAEGARPAAALVAADAVLRRMFPGRLAGAALCAVDPGKNALSCAAAGVASPLLVRRDGFVEPMVLSGDSLGSERPSELSEVIRVFIPGDSVVMLAVGSERVTAVGPRAGLHLARGSRAPLDANPLSGDDCALLAAFGHVGRLSGESSPGALLVRRVGSLH